MKIKRDFVTNSSSVSFIVIIPRKFNVKDFVLKNYEWSDFKGCRKDVVEFVEKIIIKKFMHEQDDEWISDTCAWDLFRMFHNEDLILYDREVDQSGAGGIKVIYTDELPVIKEDTEKRMKKYQ